MPVTCRYPWWPALILDRTDSRIPPQERRSTQTAAPVLFFGTAEFSWIDASRNISPWETEHEVRSMKDDSADFELVRLKWPWILLMMVPLGYGRDMAR